MHNKKSRQWYELKPFAPEDDGADTANMRRVIDHVSGILLVVCRDAEGLIRIYVMTRKENRGVLSSLDGIETIPAARPPFEYRQCRRYSMKRHCAVPITPKETERVSIYRLFDSQVSDQACLAIHLRKIKAAGPINDYITRLDRGLPAEGIGRWIYTKPAKPSMMQREKVKAAQVKISGRNLFLCTMAVCTTSLQEMRTVETIFPAMAFAGKQIKPEKILQYITGLPSIPMFNGSRSIILSDGEIMSFLAMPDRDDVSQVNFELGSMASKSAGLRSGDVL